MPTLFAVYNLKTESSSDEYDKYLVETKIPGIRGAPWCTKFKTWKIDKVLAPAVAEPEGEMPIEPPYFFTHRFTNILNCSLPRCNTQIISRR